MSLKKAVAGYSVNRLATEEFIKPKKKTPKRSVQGKRNTTRGSTDTLGNKQNKCIIFFSFCSVKVFKWKIFSRVWEGQMVIRNNTLPVRTLFLIACTFSV